MNQENRKYFGTTNLEQIDTELFSIIELIFKWFVSKRRE